MACVLELLVRNHPRVEREQGHHDRFQGRKRRDVGGGPTRMCAGRDRFAHMKLVRTPAYLSSDDDEAEAELVNESSAPKA